MCPLGLLGREMQLACTHTHAQSSYFRGSGSVNPAADLLKFFLVGKFCLHGSSAVVRIHPGAPSIWLRDGDEALGSAGWLDEHGAVADCQAHHSLHLPIRFHNSDSSRRHLHSHDLIIVRHGAVCGAELSLHVETEKANG